MYSQCISAKQENEVECPFCNTRSEREGLKVCPGCGSKAIHGAHREEFWWQFTKTGVGVTLLLFLLILLGNEKYDFSINYLGPEAVLRFEYYSFLFSAVIGGLLGIKSAYSLRSMMSGHIRFLRIFNTSSSQHSGGGYVSDSDSCSGGGDGGGD
tara:strand:- start:1146 stop:1607 length:462 start_codon:yes stop_codon:yes gene_type:complete